MSCKKQVTYVTIPGCIEGEPVTKIIPYSAITPGMEAGDPIYSDGSDGTGWTEGACPAA